MFSRSYLVIIAILLVSGVTSENYPKGNCSQKEQKEQKEQTSVCHDIIGDGMMVDEVCV